MKKNQVKELATKTKEELLKDLKDLRIEIGKMNLDSSMGKLMQPASLREKRRDSARVLTFLRAQELVMQNASGEFEEEKIIEKGKEKAESEENKE